MYQPVHITAHHAYHTYVPAMYRTPAQLDCRNSREMYDAERAKKSRSEREIIMNKARGLEGFRQNAARELYAYHIIAWLAHRLHVGHRQELPKHEQFLAAENLLDERHACGPLCTLSKHQELHQSLVCHLFCSEEGRRDDYLRGQSCKIAHGVQLHRRKIRKYANNWRREASLFV